MTANIEAVLNRVKSKVSESGGRDVKLTHTQVRMLLDHITSLESKVHELEDTLEYYANPYDRE